ncbi:MAG: hypothetical protein LBI04_11425, partial [Treponema sp.]|nr:hypothetical protein [Treponema sp.]
ADIWDGDYLIASQEKTLIDGAIMVVKYQGNSFVKRIRLVDGFIHLCWEDGSGTRLVVKPEAVEVQGRVIIQTRHLNMVAQ